MPELPEVERVRLSLLPRVVGRTVARVELLRRDICESFRRGRRGVVKARTVGADLLEGAVIARLERRGKQLAVVAESGRVVCVHLGMSGQLLWKGAGAELPAGHVHAVWSVGDGRVVFRDPRRFGGLWTFESFEDLVSARWSLLGPDALSVSVEQLGAGLAGSRRAIKAALLDQGVIAGVGNIYADEALFVAGVRPTRRADKVRGEELAALGGAIRSILARSIESGGSTLRDYVDADGERGKHQLAHAVYGRAGEACVRCRGVLRGGVVAQRTTVWCPQCQG